MALATTSLSALLAAAGGTAAGASALKEPVSAPMASQSGSEANCQPATVRSGQHGEAPGSEMIPVCIRGNDDTAGQPMDESSVYWEERNPS